MSGIILANREHYLALVHELLSESISGEGFSKAFLAERTRDLHKEDELVKQWPRRYDLELAEALKAGRLSAEEFSAQWHALWNYPKDSPFITFFEKLFWVIEDYEPDLELYETGGSQYDTWFHDEDELRRRVADLLGELQRAESAR